MKVFNRVYLTALLAGGIGGLLLAGIQQFTIAPMILEAEAYEIPDDAGHHAVVVDQGSVEVWSSEGGVERTFYTTLIALLSNVMFWIAWVLSMPPIIWMIMPMLTTNLPSS